MRRASKKVERGAVLIGIIALKFFKAALFLASGVALLFFRRDPSSRWLLRVADQADGDPRLRLTAHFFRDLSHGFELHFSAIVGACLVAGIAVACEGAFLALGYTWAPWVTIFLTGVWIPVEIWEVIHRFSLRTFLLMAVNVAIVAYLFVRRKDFHRHLGE
jgi:hypothetical protein